MKLVRIIEVNCSLDVSADEAFSGPLNFQAYVIASLTNPQISFE